MSLAGVCRYPPRRNGRKLRAELTGGFIRGVMINHRETYWILVGTLEALRLLDTTARRAIAHMVVPI